MADTILLDTVTWDLVADASDNIAAAREPYSLAQDAASAIRTFLGEVYYDTSLGVPWFQLVLGERPSLETVRRLLVAEAESVPGVASAQVFFTAFTGRALSGQVQVTSAAGAVSAAAF